MAKAPKPPKPIKLNVYRTAIGFHDAFVAARSQAAALRAWGTMTDLFAAGRAALVEDPDLTAEPLARPGDVIKRLRGDETAMLGPEPAELFEPRLPESAAAKPRTKRPAADRSTKPVSPPPPPPPPPPDRSNLEAAERALEAAEGELRDELDAIAAERAALDARETEARMAGARRADELRKSRDAAAGDYERAVKATSRRR